MERCEVNSGQKPQTSSLVESDLLTVSYGERTSTQLKNLTGTRRHFGGLRFVGRFHSIRDMGKMVGYYYQ
jgi:hypothetical protein